MPISFHCEACKKKIKAPDQAGGKWGKCPYCNHRCYVPSPKRDDEPELKLAPIDPSQETKIDLLMQETYHLTHQILQQRHIDLDTSSSAEHADKAMEKNILKDCIIYLRLVADGHLQQAVERLEALKNHRKMALRILSAMGRAEKPEPELADIPEPTLQGLIRQACAELGAAKE